MKANKTIRGQEVLNHRRLYREFCTQKMKANKTIRGQKVLNHRRRKDKESKSSSDLAANNQILKQQKTTKWQDSPHTINTECQRTQLPQQKTPFGKLD
jgi:hypothetical protein